MVKVKAYLFVSFLLSGICLSFYCLNLVQLLIEFFVHEHDDGYSCLCSCTASSSMIRSSPVVGVLR